MGLGVQARIGAGRVMVADGEMGASLQRRGGRQRNQGVMSVRLGGRLGTDHMRREAEIGETRGDLVAVTARCGDEQGKGAAHEPPAA